jgi:hypothetical protein
MLFPIWFEIGLDIAQLSLPVVVLVGFLIYLRRRSSGRIDIWVQAHFRPKAQ